MDRQTMMGALAHRMHRGARRAVWSNEARVHLAVHEVDEDDREAFASRLRDRLEQLPGVRWARYNGYLARVIVDRDPARAPLEAIVREIESIEEELCASATLASSSHAYPGEAEPEHRRWIEVAADAASLAISVGLRFRSSARTPHDIDFAAITATLDGIPRIKKSMARSVSRRAADLTLELMKAVSMIAVRSETGPLTAIVGHALILRESHARRAAWAEREPELCGERERHAWMHRGRKARPAPLRHGPIERYEEGAIPITLGAFGASVFFTRDTEGSASPLFAGLPRAARHGRTSFTAHLGWILARRGVVVFEIEALGRLDRIDTVALTSELALEDPSGATRIVRRARELELGVRVIGGEELEALEWLRPAERWSAKRPCKAVRRMQRAGAGVLLISGGPTDGFRAADLGLALSSDPPPWGAHVVARHGVDDALLFLDAIASAREVALESVAITVAEAATGLSISLAGLERQTTRRVMTVANAASMIAMINGVRLAHRLAIPPPAPPADSTPYHEMDPDEVLALLGSTQGGLSMHEAEARRVHPPAPASSLASFGRALVDELASPMTPILAAGAGLSAAVGSVVDAGLIASALGINGLVGAGQRFGARRALQELEHREERAVRVLRDDAFVEVAVDALVKGDVIELGAGELVPADCRLLSAPGVEVDESSLTGESLPVPKDARPVRTELVAERASMIYAGTSISAGCARAVVVAAGDETELGRARALPERRVAGGVEARLSSLAAITGPVAGASALGIMGSGLLRGRPFPEVVTSAVGLGVAAVPEGLPILATLAQLAAARRLTRRGALVKNPRSLEALGRVDVLCADKTGTLTEGSIRLAVVSDGARVSPVKSLDPALRRVLAVALRASPESGGGKLPHPTDDALVRGAEAVGVSTALDGMRYERGPELPFEPGRGFHASVGVEDGARVLSVKGAPETILPRCARTRDGVLKKRQLKRLLKEARTIGRQGYRVLAVAERVVQKRVEPCEDEVCELVFLGFVGLADPVRASAREAIRALSGAGVRVLMLTGDHPSTAEAIAEQLELASAEVVTGADIERLDDDALAERLERASIFARVTPAQKVRLVRVLAARGRTVAMTGDGANDAAAIALADVGIAVGAHATGAARSVADLVVTDGRIETIVDAILEGRAMWASVRDAVSILVGGNFGEIAFALIPGLITGRAPLNARQLLLVNLVTDTLPSLAIAISPPRLEDVERLMREGPEASLGERLDRDLITRAVVTSGAAAAAYSMSRLTGGGPARAGTVGLVALTGAQLGQTLMAGGRDLGVFAASAGSLAALFAVIEIPGLSHFFGCRPLGPLALTQALGATAAATAAAWALPRWLDRRQARARPAAPSREPANLDPDPGEEEPLFGGLLEAA